MTNTARDRVRARIRAATGERERPSDALRATFEQLRLSRPRGENELAAMTDPRAEFASRAAASGATVIGIDTLNALPPIVNEHCGASEAAIAVAPQSHFDDLAWSRPLATDYRRGAPCGVVEASLGIAETGTLCFHSHVVPSGLLFLVDTLVAVVSTSAIVPRQEQAWQQLPKRARAVQLVTGPSRTADVEQTIQVGAHGPRALVVCVLGDL